MIRGIFALLALTRWFFCPDRSHIEEFSMRRLRFHDLQKAVNEWTLVRRKAVAIVIHSWLFPFFLTLYLIVLLIDQTHVFNLHLSSRFFLLDKTFLLSITVVMAMITAMVDEQLIQKRTKVVVLPRAWQAFVVLCGALWMLGTYIIAQQTHDLGWISYLIATIAWILLILMGFVLLEERDEV